MHFSCASLIGADAATATAAAFDCSNALDAFLGRLPVNRVGARTGNAAMRSPCLRTHNPNMYLPQSGGGGRLAVGLHAHHTTALQCSRGPGAINCRIIISFRTRSGSSSSGRAGVRVRVPIYRQGVCVNTDINGGLWHARAHEK